MDQFLSEEIDRALRTLAPRDAKVLRLYFGLDGGREHTLEEIGGMLGVTRERVRQLRDRALKRLREGDSRAGAGQLRGVGSAAFVRRPSALPPALPSFHPCRPPWHPVSPRGTGSSRM